MARIFHADLDSFVGGDDGDGDGERTSDLVDSLRLVAVCKIYAYCAVSSTF